MPKQPRTKPVSAAQVRSYAAKAAEFAEAAASDLAAGRNIAATSLAIHAGINAADAVCGARVVEQPGVHLFAARLQVVDDAREVLDDLEHLVAREGNRVHRSTRRRTTASDGMSPPPYGLGLEGVDTRVDLDRGDLPGLDLGDEVPHAEP